MLRNALITLSGTTCDVRGFVADFFPLTLIVIFPAEPSYVISCRIVRSIGSAISLTCKVSSPTVDKASIARIFEFFGYVDAASLALPSKKHVGSVRDEI